MELIRLLLLQQEIEKEPEGLNTYSDDAQVYHIALIIDAGLVEGKTFLDEAGTPTGAVVTRLTWGGHEFLDSVRDPSIWQSAKNRVLKPGASWTFGILVEFAKQEAMKRLGLMLLP